MGDRMVRDDSIGEMGATKFEERVNSVEIALDALGRRHLSRAATGVQRAGN
jgi:hypothetical protein